MSNLKIENTFLAGHIIGRQYERLFLEPGQEYEYIRNYIDLLDGEVEYLFRIKEYFNLKVVGLKSALGDVSLVVLDKEHQKQLPDFIQKTRTMYIVDSIDAVYEKANNIGIPILQARTPNIMGAQGRLELSPGYIIELTEATNTSLFYPDISTIGLPKSKLRLPKIGDIPNL